MKKLLLLFVSAASALIVLGAKPTPPPPAPPTFTASVSAVDFGTVAVGTTATVMVRVDYLAGFTGREIAVQGSSSIAASLGGSLVEYTDTAIYYTFPVTFSPTRPAAAKAEITVSDDTGYSVVIDVTGRGGR